MRLGTGSDGKARVFGRRFVSLGGIGFSVSWIAVRGKDSEVVLGELGLSATGERDELPGESPIGGAGLDGGWYVVVFDRYDHPLTGDEVLKELSRGCDVVAAGAEEHVMASDAEGWRDGERVWSIAHDADQGLQHLELEGSLPEGFEALRHERFEELEDAGGDEADVDYVFDIPLDVATQITGFSHTDSEPEEGFAVLTEATR
jgi:hypothetical protein